ncbi:MAG: molybdopterin oxidoreductase, iron-sulfur binding subunit, partial [Fibrobacteres bacterium]|nr:molybdopterin oxidoreductase, iron-sulfur binding subunit [Fibrobacterota bacterium]
MPSLNPDPMISRRDFLRLMAASLALAGIPGCTTRQPKENILPYVNPPKGWVPGRPRYYATTMETWGHAVGLLVKSDQGRPIKIEGNPLHPWSLGAADIFAQASLLTLYDPARSATVLRQGLAGTWEACCAELAAKREAWLADGGKGLRILIGSMTSPSALAAIRSLLQTYPEAGLHVHDPLDSGHAISGAALYAGAGAGSAPVYRFANARVIVSLDADFLGFGGGRTRYSRDFAEGRRAESPQGMNRLYAAEGCPSLTGAMADRRLPIRPSEIPSLALLLAGALGMPEFAGLPESDAAASGAGPEALAWTRSAAGDLSAQRGRGLILAGESQPAEVHALALAMNVFLGNLGSTLDLFDPPHGVEALPARTLPALTEDMAAGRVDTLLILDANPAYTGPGDGDFPGALAKVPLSIHSGLYRDETASLCRWHVPAAHYLEAWGDGRARDGTLSLTQPMIEPLYGGKTRLEMLAAMRGEFQADAHALVRDYWRNRYRDRDIAGADFAAPGGFPAFWERSLGEGVMAGSAETPKTPKTIPAAKGWSDVVRAGISRVTQVPAVLEIAFRP